MATFIPEIGDITPQVEYFRPNLELMAGYLETRQGRFNQSRDELNSVYTQLKSLDLTLDDNKQRREEFFKAADQELKKLANVDISLPENLTAAKRIFDPLVKDDAMVEDLLFTGKIKNVLSTAEKFKNSSNEEDRKRYNPMSVQYAALKQQEYVNSSGEARKAVAASNMGYASNVNLMERATALAKEMDLNITVDTLNGGYKVTTKNGQLVAPSLQQAFTSNFMNDPEVQEYYRQQAYVNVQSKIQELVPQMGYDAAVEALEGVLKAQSELAYATEKSKVQEARKKLIAKKAMMENQIQSEGIIAGSEEHRDYLDVLRHLEMAGEEEEYVDSKLASTAKQISSLNDLYNLSYNLDLTSDIYSAASVLANKNAEMTTTEDKFALAEQQHQYKMSEIAYKASFDTESNNSPGGPGGKLEAIDWSVNEGAVDRGAMNVEKALEQDILQSESALDYYSQEQDKVYQTLVYDYLSAKNGGVLGSTNGKGGKAAADKYFAELNQMTPAEKKARIESDYQEILESGKYNVELSENFEGLNNSQKAANDEHKAAVGAIAGNIMSQFDGYQNQILSQFYLNNDELPTKEEFIEKVIPFIESSINDGLGGMPGTEAFVKKRVKTGGYNYMVPSAGGLTTRTSYSVDPEAIGKFYDNIKGAISTGYKNANVNVHKYFTPNVTGDGSALSIKVDKSYVLDPYLYYKESAQGHAETYKGYLINAGLRSAFNNSDGYIYEGSIRENDFFMSEGFEDADDNKATEGNIGLFMLDQMAIESKKNQDSKSESRRLAILDVADGVVIGDQKYVEAQYTFEPAFLEELKDQYPKMDFPNKITAFAPENAMPVGYYADAGSKALLASIRVAGERITTLPNNTGSITYTYDEENRLIEAVGKIREVDGGTGGYAVKFYSDAVSEEGFDFLRKNIQSVYNAVQENNKALLDQFEKERGVIRVTDLQKLK